MAKQRVASFMHLHLTTAELGPMGSPIETGAATLGRLHPFSIERERTSLTMAMLPTPNLPAQLFCTEFNCACPCCNPADLRFSC